MSFDVFYDNLARKQSTLMYYIVFFQVRFVYECFRRLRPGLSVMALHGSMSQAKRVKAYQEFCNKEFAAMFCTDVGSRGLGI